MAEDDETFEKRLDETYTSSLIMNIRSGNEKTDQLTCRSPSKTTCLHPRVIGTIHSNNLSTSDHPLHHKYSKSLNLPCSFSNTNSFCFCEFINCIVGRSAYKNWSRLHLSKIIKIITMLRSQFPSSWKFPIKLMGF